MGNNQNQGSLSHSFGWQMRVINFTVIRLMINRSRNWHVCATSVPGLGVLRGPDIIFSQACAETLNRVLWSLLCPGCCCGFSIPHLVSLLKDKTIPFSVPWILRQPRLRSHPRAVCPQSIPEHLYCAAAFSTSPADHPALSLRGVE